MTATPSPSTATCAGADTVLTHPDRAERRAGHRPRALPRRLRPPRGHPRRRPGLPPRPPGRRADDGTTGPGRTSTSTPHVPTAGSYGLFLDFKHDGSGPHRRVHGQTNGDEPVDDPATDTAATDPRSTPGEADEHHVDRPPTGAVELDITGMTCASCANRIERKLNKLDGVTATVNYATEKAKVTFADGRRAPTTCSPRSSRPGYAATLPAAPPSRAPTAEAPSRPEPRRCASGCWSPPRSASR